MDNVKNLKDVNEQLQKKYKLLEDIIKKEKEGKNLGVAEAKTKKEIAELERKSLGFSSRGLNIEKQIENIQKGVLSSISGKVDLEQKLNGLKKLTNKGTKEEQKEAKKLLGIMSGVGD